MQCDYMKINALSALDMNLLDRCSRQLQCDDMRGVCYDDGRVMARYKGLGAQVTRITGAGHSGV